MIVFLANRGGRQVSLVCTGTSSVVAKDKGNATLILGGSNGVLDGDINLLG